jgi:integrase
MTERKDSDGRRPTGRDSRPRSAITLPGGNKGRRSKYKGDKLPPEVLTRQELNRLLAEFPPTSKNGTRGRAAIALFARTELKVGQLVKLRPAHYDENAAVLNVPGRDQSIEVDPVTRRYLDAWLAARRAIGAARLDPLSCTTETGHVGRPWDPGHLRKAIQSRAKTAGIDKRVTPEGLRLTFRDSPHRSRLERLVALHVDEDDIAYR